MYTINFSLSLSVTLLLVYRPISPIVVLRYLVMLGCSRIGTSSGHHGHVLSHVWRAISIKMTFRIINRA